MKDYKIIETSYEVWAVLFAKHGKSLKVFSSYSSPQGSLCGNPRESRMETSYGFAGAYYPLMETRSTWDFQPDKPWERKNEKHIYWLCIPIKDES